MTDAKKRRPGRPTDKPLTAIIRSRTTASERDKYIALGGSEWLRRMINEAPL